MAYQNATLEHRLDRVEASAPRVLEVATLDIGTRQKEIWLPFIDRTYGNEDAIFTRMRIDRDLFERVYTFVRHVPVERRGKKGAVQEKGEKLLLDFTMKVVDSIETMTCRFKRTRSLVDESACGLSLNCSSTPSLTAPSFSLLRTPQPHRPTKKAIRSPEIHRCVHLDQKVMDLGPHPPYQLFNALPSFHKDQVSTV